MRWHQLLFFGGESCNSSRRSTTQRGEGQTSHSDGSEALAPHTALGQLWLTSGINNYGPPVRGTLPTQSHFMNIWSRNIVDIKTFICFPGRGAGGELER